MFVTLLGVVTDVRPVQLPKAQFPILVTPIGIVIEVRLVHFSKADFPILVTSPSNFIMPFSFSYVLLVIFAPKTLVLFGTTAFPSEDVYQISSLGICGSSPPPPSWGFL